MNTKLLSTRRLFFWKAGAALSAPLALAAGAAKASDTNGDKGEAHARLALLENVEAIRALNQAYARHVSSGDREALAALFAEPAAAEAALHVDDGASAAGARAKIRKLSSEHFGELDVIEVAPDGKRATARIHCAVALEAPIEPRCPLVDMARAQGGGVVRRSQRGVLENEYAKRNGAWKITRSVFRAA